MMKWEASCEDEDAFEGRWCVSCASSAPPASAFTLISSRHGWRLHRGGSQDAPRMEWFCPTCWAARRSANDPPDDGRGASLAGSRADERSQPPPRCNVIRSTGTVDMTTTICRLLAKLRSRATRGPAVETLLRALGEIELEASTWSVTTGTPERRKDIWMELRALDARADALVASK